MLTTAAWAAPVMIASISTPAFAASGAVLTLSWTRTAQPVGVGVAYGASEVTVLSGGLPAPAGTLVSFSLGSGLAWTDGSNGVKTVPTAGGVAVLPGTKATVQGFHTVTAVVGTVSASTTLSTVAAGNKLFNFDGGGAVAPVSTCPTEIVEMSVGMNWLALRAADSRWFGYAHASDGYRPVTYNGSPLLIDAGIKTERSNVFYATSGGQIYAIVPGTNYTNGVPIPAVLRGAPPSGIASWAANENTVYATGTNGDWYVNTSGTTWAIVDAGYPRGTMRTAYTIEKEEKFSWALANNGDVWINQFQPKNRTNSLSPMRELAIGTDVVYGIGTDDKWYAKGGLDYQTTWTRVQYSGADFVLRPTDRFFGAEGADYSFVVRDDGSIYRTAGGGTKAVQTAERIQPPTSSVRAFVGGVEGSMLIAGADGRMFHYTKHGVWNEMTVNSRSINVFQVGFRDDGANYRWAIGTN